MNINGKILIFTFVLIKISAAYSYKNVSFLTCKAFSNKNHISPFSCEVTLTFDYSDSSEYLPSCGSDENTLWFRINNYRNRSPFPFTSSSFICTSSSPISVQLNFQDNSPDVEYTYFRQEREYTSNTGGDDVYRLKIQLPVSFQMGNPVKLVKYTIYSVNNSISEIKALFMIGGLFPGVFCTEQLHGDGPIDVLSEMVVIPCISFETSISLYRKKDMVYEKLTVDNQMLSYDLVDGFRMNFSSFGAGEYVCADDRNATCQNKTFIINGIEFRPEEKNIFLTKNYRDTETIYCSNVAGKLSFVYKVFNLNDTTNATATTEWKPLLNISSTVFNISIQYYGTQFPKKYYAVAIVPYIIKSQRLANSSWSSDIDGIVIGCNSSFGEPELNPDLRNWTIIYADIFNNYTGPLKMLSNYEAIFCTSPQLVTDLSHLQPAETTDVTLQQFECQNHVQCQLFANKHCLHMGTDKEKALHITGVDSLIPCKKTVYEASLSSCIELGNDDSTTEYRRTRKRCRAIETLRKGFVHCNALNLFWEQRLYFEGFDGNTYYYNAGKNPTPSAILKISSLSKEEDFYTKGRFTFRCEAHSFFHQHGLKWYFVFRNGSAIEPPPDWVQHFHPQPQDKTNPESNVVFEFMDENVVQIFCSAPVLESTQWDKIGINVTIYKSTSPIISTVSTDISWTDGEKGNSIVCQAIGCLPRPTIKWTKNGQEIKSPLNVLDQLTSQILIFPVYNESLSGNYVCTASNLIGNDTKIFIISTLVATGRLYYILVAVHLCLAGIIAVLVLVYVRHEKIKKYLAMKEIIRMLNGDSRAHRETLEYQHLINEEEDNVCPMYITFDINYEIEKHSFYIDRTKLLGKGEYGEVYKGCLEGVDGPVAFKTVKKKCSIEQLKALVCETKIMMYVGKHDNLNSLLGVYRQEIKDGIFFIATEFCELDSLQYLLSSYRHLFQACPILKATANLDAETSLTIPSDNYTNRHITIHSVYSLLKWSAQIASGMDYLASKNVIHSDLAARNVLLTAEANAKVSDFGLSRRTYNYTEYVKTSKDPLPWRYLAIESLVTNTFSTKSDIWSFGITLWEMFSLGEIPYPGQEPTMEFVQKLEQGMRNIKPKYSSTEIYRVMKDCWNYDPNKRPTFFALKIIFQDAVNKWKCNIDINDDLEISLENIAASIASADYIEIQ